MIRYALKCPNGHRFESWFQSGTAFDSLKAAGHVACPECGATQVDKAPMAPSVAAAPPEDHPLAKLRREVEAKSDYVGTRFAAEARKMHDGDAPARPIHGEARIDEARALIEDGVPVLPLPFLPTRRVN